jgi:hypothetical protein
LRRKLPQRKGLFGSKKHPVMLAREDGVTMAHRGMPAVLQQSNNQQAPTMPGPISGIAGGTFNTDGTQATPVQPEAEAPRPLGGSMRQPFDYDAAMKALAGEYKKPKDWQIALAILGDGLSGASGRQGYAVQNIVNQRNAHSQRQFEAAKQILDWRQGDYAAQRDADLRAANPFTIGRERLAYNPATGDTEMLYRGRQDGEIYADNLGFDRGSEEWTAAVEDYVLRSSGPSAHARDLEVDDYRTENDRSLEGYRQQNRLEMENARQRNRSAMENTRQGNRMTLRETPPARRGSRPSGIVTVKTPAEARALPSGTKFRTPDGKVKVRP